MNAEMIDQLAARLEATADLADALPPESPEFEAARREIESIERVVVDLQGTPGTPPEELAYVPEDLLAPEPGSDDEG